jgi:hypothetical protein
MSEESSRGGTPRASELDSFLLEFPSEGVSSAYPGDAEVDAPTPVDFAQDARDPQTVDEPKPIVHVGGPPATAEPAARHATVTEFPVHATRPPVSNVPAVIPNDVTLLDLLEKQGGLDWRRAVAVVHQVCIQLKGHGPHAPILLEARNILVSNDGLIRLLPSQPGGDPLVIQLGRLLRTILRGNEAPPELRLLLAQATFELPIFESVDDVDKALQQLERLEQTAGNGKAFTGPVVLPAPGPETDRGREGRPHAVRDILAKSQAQKRRNRGRSASGSREGLRYGMQIGLAIVVVALASALFLNQAGWLRPQSQAASPRVAAATGPEPSTPAPVVLPEKPATETTPTSGTHAVASMPAPPIPPMPQNSATPGTGRTEPSRRERPATVVMPSGGTAREARLTATASAPVPSPRESERRANALIAQGQTAEAAMVFEGLLVASPLYEPKPSEITPEAMTTFRTTQRLILPGVAQRSYERGRAALSAGDPDRALTLGREAIAILDRRLGEANPPLREQVLALIEEATVASSAADEIVYSPSDRGIVPPRELTRQFPATTPIGVPPHRVGTLDMIIDKEGGVEFVKLHTPLNRYHERHIVQAAKAWRYRPAMRNGKPVKFRLTVKINLPESGTDF